MNDVIVSIRELSHTYMRGTPLAAAGLQDANLILRQGEFAALIGRADRGNPRWSVF